MSKRKSRNDSCARRRARPAKAYCIVYTRWHRLYFPSSTHMGRTPSHTFDSTSSPANNSRLVVYTCTHARCSGARARATSQGCPLHWIALVALLQRASRLSSLLSARSSAERRALSLSSLAIAPSIPYTQAAAHAHVHLRMHNMCTCTCTCASAHMCICTHAHMHTYASTSSCM